MKSDDYKAVRERGVEEFGIYPLPIAWYDTTRPPYEVKQANSRSIRACPRGLHQATVVEDRAEWVETFSLACGDRTYTKTRRNGVLVEMPLESMLDKGRLRSVASEAKVKALPQTTVVKRDGKKIVRMVVPKACILAPWDEYALIEAEREKAAEEQQVRNDRLNAAGQAVGALKTDWYEVSRSWDEESESYVPNDPFDYEVEREWNGHKDLRHVRGEITLTLARAEQIGEAVEALRAGNAKKALKLLTAKS